MAYLLLVIGFILLIKGADLFVDGSCSLAKTLNIIGSYGFNMRSLRSRPMKELMWNYYFYVELEGNPNSEDGQDMIKALGIFCDELKLVGTYLYNTEK